MTALPARLWPLARWLVGPLVALQRAAASVRRRAGHPGADPAWAAAGGFEFVARRPIEPPEL